MDEDERVAEFAAFVAALPPQAETELVGSPVASTAFHLARRAGWSLDTLTADAAAAWRRTQDGGVVINRLRTLSSTSPSGRAPAAKRHWPRWVRQEREPLPAEWVHARVMLLWKIRDEKAAEDEAALRMRALIALQHQQDDQPDEPQWNGQW